jgi:hypothetical protein
MFTLQKLFHRAPRAPTPYPHETVIRIDNITGKYNRRYKVPSRTNQRLYYNVNPQKMTCDCKGFREVRGAFPEGDVRRVCYHQYYQMRKLGIEQELDSMVRLLLLYGRGQHHFFRTQKGALNVAFGYQPHSPHVKVIAVFDNEHPTIGTYNLARHRWEDDDQGFNPHLRVEREDEILDVLTGHFRLW